MPNRIHDEPRDRAETAGAGATPLARVRASLIAGRPGRALRALLTFLRDNPPSVGV